MPVFKTPFNGYSVKFSPFYESRLAVATSQNFGILGNGRLHVIDLSPAPLGPAAPHQPITELIAYDTADGVYDVAWSESHDSLLVAAIADGSVKLYDVALPPASNPLRSLHEHTRELWTVDRPASVRTFKEHAYCVYSAVWNPRHADVFASASGDCTLRVWDVREPGSTMIIPAHELEILACDWNKYDDCCIATASVDKSIKVWDVRSIRVPISVLNGHSYAVRKIKFSPHRQSSMMSCSYDMSVCLWDYMVEDALVARYDHHTEFAVGVDMSVLVEGLLASTGWDELAKASTTFSSPIQFYFCPALQFRQSVGFVPSMGWECTIRKKPSFHFPFGSLLTCQDMVHAWTHRAIIADMSRYGGPLGHKR
ncbi:unnamed protein product [Prunus brigantina]